MKDTLDKLSISNRPQHVLSRAHALSVASFEVTSLPAYVVMS